MREYFELLLNQWREMSRVQKISLVAIAVIVFFGLLTLIIMAGQSEYVVLFKNLELEESKAITAKLDAAGFRYRLSDEGTTILVLANERAKIRLELAGENALPNRSKGWSEILAETSIFNQSREMQDLQFLRGLQGELESTIMQSELVERARVLIFKSPERAFEEDQKPDQASVSLKLKPFVKLGKHQVMGIRNLVSNATGIDPKMIKIIDQHLTDLTLDLEDTSTLAGLSATQLEIQERYARTLEKKAQGLLDQVLGPGYAVARLTVELNFDQLEENMEKYSPPVEGEEGGIVISEEGLTEVYEGKGKKPGGPAGTDSNVPSYPQVDEEKGKYDRRELKKNYEVNSHKVHRIISPGAVKRISLSVLIDEGSKIDEKKMDDAKKAVAAAVGIDERRGDSIALVRLPFNREFVRAQEMAFEKQQKEEFYTKIAVLLALALLALVLFFIIWKNRQAIADLIRKPKRLEIPIPAEIKEVEMPVTDEERARREIGEKIKAFAARKPEDVAKLLQIWLTEE